MRGIVTQSIATAQSITASGNGVAADIGQFHGLALIALNGTGVNTGTNTIKLQHSEDGSTNWADTGDVFAAVTNVAATGQQSLLVNADKYRRFVRVVDTMAGGANAMVRSVSIIGSRKSS